MNTTFITSNEQVRGYDIPVVSARLDLYDYIGAVRVRWGIRRDNYRVNPGLYAIGSPGPGSDVFVTSNYKLTFDTLRKNLSGLNGWILVLDTRGVNVWCAAGKGTFSTNELINKINQVSLGNIVNHKRLILPQLSATGVAAHRVREKTGFNVIYGPVRANDIRKFITGGYRSDKEMRKVTFSFKDRIKLIPNDFMYGKYYLIGAMLILALLSGLSRDGISFSNFSNVAAPAVIKVFLGYFGGIVLTPMILPYIPGRYFSMKGICTGLAVFIAAILFLPAENIVEEISWFFIITSLSSFVAMNFTGSSTFTSLSGVKKEMKRFLPVQIGFALSGLILHIIGKLIN